MTPVAECAAGVSSPDPTHPDHHAALQVLLALGLLAVGEAQVLPVARGQQARPRLRLGQQPRLDLIVGVDADPGVRSEGYGWRLGYRTEEGCFLSRGTLRNTRWK